MYSNKRKRLLILYHEACEQFVDRKVMLQRMADGEDPHGEYIKFYNQMLNADAVEHEFVERFWDKGTKLREYTTISDNLLEDFIGMVMDNLTCKTQENNV